MKLKESGVKNAEAKYEVVADRWECCTGWCGAVRGGAGGAGWRGGAAPAVSTATAAHPVVGGRRRRRAGAPAACSGRCTGWEGARASPLSNVVSRWIAPSPELLPCARSVPPNATPPHATPSPLCYSPYL
ncbi:unnamed protein product [Parnassius apollo]|uniref:(apollo) hypothetical protein n=1 Tax=Parnassius apollo TaxID=110799 RepID=A0A8S3W0H8_PARAO|nr:unnamed protein product [Parnassius apollo]